ncbi:DUF3793 family protein [uncultured Gemmiger sp.]|uniref:DUF3793 family protein n=1 Tax=uncultured Gemmiger sp. TaxID=1623490 RepID=UPI0025D09DA1|nr:DUF3793 family protein [uncultured Gemmiger sp.]
MLERYLITQCAPTLANLKTASLFRCLCPGREELDAWRQALGTKGIELTVLCCDGTYALVYVYRPARLARDLQRPGTGWLLRGYGYPSTEMAPALDRLRQRLAAGQGFPHEIGLFLGYPVGDVAGFIRNRGKNCRCVGCWKVYCNECEARRTFARLKKCTQVYTRLWQQGRTVPQLTVAA